MKIPIVDLTLENIFILKEKNEWSDHFNLVVWPRILVWLGLKEQFKEINSLDWKIYYSPDNMHNNMISMHLKDPNKVFNFYFQVPLVQNLSFNLYLGDSTYNFFEIYPLLLSKGVVKKDELPLKATSTILPHLVLSTQNSKYNNETLWKVNDVNYSLIMQNDALINLLTYNFKRFIPPLQKIINSEWRI